jgi:hypothetical protein
MKRAALVVLLALGALPASAAATYPGNAVLAKPAGKALAIWDASPLVATIVKNKIADDVANAMLERDALHVLATMTPLIDKGSTAITVRVTYAMTGAVSPNYGHVPFAGIETYATLTAPASNALADRDGWKELGPKDAIPEWFAFNVVGLLPPRS